MMIALPIQKEGYDMTKLVIQYDRSLEEYAVPTDESLVDYYFTDDKEDAIATFNHIFAGTGIEYQIKRYDVAPINCEEEGEE